MNQPVAETSIQVQERGGGSPARGSIPGSGGKEDAEGKGGKEDAEGKVRGESVEGSD